MIDRITRLFRRNPPGNAAAKPADPQAEAQRARDDARQAQAIADAERELAAGAPAATALAIARGDLPAGLRCQALARVDDTDALLAIALGDKVARVRLAAAERLTAAGHLEQLRRDSNDKAVQRHARDVLKALRDHEQAQQQTGDRIARLLEAIAQHAARAFEPLYDARLDSLEAGWREVAAAASAADQERFAELAALARDTVARHAAQVAAREQAIAAKQELIAACNELESTAGRLAREDLSTSAMAVAALRSTQQTRWDEAAAAAPVDAPLAARFRKAAHTLDRWLAAVAESTRAGQDAAALFAAIDGSGEDGDATPGEPSLDALDEWQSQLDALRARIDWPAGLAPAPLLADIDEALRRVAQRRRAAQADVREQVAQMRKRRGALRRMIDEGQLRAAVRTHQWLQKRIAELPARDAAQENAALAPLAEALAKLHDWYEFASVPKKTELCAGMEALVAPTDDIATRTAEVRALRERWNALCAADPDADPELRARFDRAAQAAFAPCAAWYDAQHRLQDENIAKRAALCDTLEATLAQPPTDAAGWRARERHERDLRAQWKALEPVRWPEARATQDRFHALVGRLRGLLAAERQRGIDARQAVIARARALATHEPVEAAITAARNLQDDWKRTGWTDPRDDRALWQDFRAAVDAVFARRDAARDAERAAREAQAAEAARLRAGEEARRVQRREAARAARQAEIDAALALADAESARLRGEPVDEAAMQARLDVLPPRSALAAALRARLATLQQAPAAATLAANAEKLAALTLDLEILLDLPSPPELAGARMQAKIAKLNDALRQRGGAVDNDPQRSLEDAWLAVGPVAGAERAPLLARFRQAVARG